MLAPFRVPRIDQIELFKLLLGIIVISYLKPYCCIQVIWMRWEYEMNRIILLNRNAWNHLIVCMQMSYY